MTPRKRKREKHENRDPITKQPGSHPIGTAAGSGSGAAAGALIGAAVAGPAGALVGGALGAVGGGAVGHVAAEKVNPTTDDEHNLLDPREEARVERADLPGVRDPLRDE